MWQEKNTIYGKALHYIPWSHALIPLHQRKRSNRSLSDEWETPNELYKKLCNKYRIYPILDVCATSQNTKCKMFYDIKADGLKEPWKVDAWCNPPQSIARQFITKASKENKENNINILMIIPVNTTVTKIGEDLIWNDPRVEIHPLLPTPRFLYKGKPSKDSARNRYCTIIWRNNYAKD